MADSIRASEQGLQRIDQARRKKGWNKDAPAWIDAANAFLQRSGGNVTRSTLQRFWKKPVRQENFVAICKAVGIDDWESIADFSQLSASTSSEAEDVEEVDYWQNLCRKMLDRQISVTTNLLTKSDGIRVNLNDIFVPLGVVERRRKPRQDSDTSPERGSDFYEEKLTPNEEKITPISHDQFFEEVLKQQKSQFSNGSRIALIGEPGAGKTTQLQKVGKWILDELEEIPIWVSLADLREKSLQEYLIEDWLRNATQEIVGDSQLMKNEFAELLTTGRVWLLLDGVDEMSNSNALQQIARQTQEELSNRVRVVLTCRLNIWDAGKNELDRFDVYRNLNFEYPTQVHQFIDRWFAKKSVEGQRFKQALKQRGEERVRDLIKNPLRLTLLCYSWQLREGELPETKAELYKWFVETLYEWNKRKVSIELTAAKRQELNQAFGELSKQAIDRKMSRFRLEREFIESFLGGADNHGSLFYLALKLGWLNPIGVAKENPFEDVFAFFHPTFQEYFAALAIEDCHFFLNHVPKSRDYRGYRVFEPQWKEVFLLWLGRKDICKIQKEQLISALSDFEDGCGNFYRYQAYLLSVAGIAEFKKFSKAEQVISKLVELSLDQKLTILEEVEMMLTETDRERVIKHLSVLIDDPCFIESREQIAIKLGRVDPENPRAIAVLSSLLDNSNSYRAKTRIAGELGKISPGNVKAIAFLETVVDDPELNPFERKSAAEYLHEISPDNPKITAAFIQMLHDDKDEDWWATDGRDEILDSNRDLFICLITAIYGLERFSDGSQEIINVLIRVAVKCKVQLIIDRIILCLGKFDSIHAVLILNPALAQSKNEENTLRISRLLGKADPGSWKVVGILLNLLKSENEEIRVEAIRNLEEVGANMPEAIAAYKAIPVLINLLDDAEWRYYQNYIAACLGEIGDCQPDILSALENLLENSEDEETQLKAATALKKISHSHQKATHFLINFLKTESYRGVYEHEVDTAFELLRQTRSSEQLLEIVRELSEELNDQTMENNSQFHKSCFDIIWYASQNLAYPDFYRAWHDET